MGKSTISTGPFSIAMLVHQRVSMKNGGFMGLIQEKYRKMDVNVCRNGSCP